MNEEDLIRWCESKAKNGISQHDQKWKDAKVDTVGGSSIAIIKGLNPFTNLRTYIATKLGLVRFISDIKPQWGNLFEEVIKLEVEWMFKCKVHGEDLFINDCKYYGTSYSPDGLGVVDGKVVLFEFKCPQRRIPSKEPPVYYVPQVKMGLELLEPPEYGIYVEAVYRRCSWPQLGPKPGFDLSLVQRPVTGTPISYGFIGFYTTAELAAKALSDIADGKVILKEGISSDDVIKIPGYLSEYEKCDAMNDLGASSCDLFENMMTLMDEKYLMPWYGRVHRETSVNKANALLNEEVKTYREFCKNGGFINYGILPWKLLQIKHHRIDPEPGYLEPMLDDIKKIIDFVKSCKDKSDDEKRDLLNKFMEDYHSGNGGFEEYEYHDV